MAYFPAPDEQIWVGVLRILLHVPGSRGLKDRRKAVQSLSQRISSRHSATVADVGHLDNPASAVLAVSVVGNDPQVLRARLDTIRGEAENHGDAYLESTELWIERMGAKGNLAAR